jgi:hypothetical protein
MVRILLASIISIAFVNCSSTKSDTNLQRLLKFENTTNYEGYALIYKMVYPNNDINTLLVRPVSRDYLNSNSYSLCDKPHNELFFLSDFIPDSIMTKIKTSTMQYMIHDKLDSLICATLVHDCNSSNKVFTKWVVSRVYIKFHLTSSKFQMNSFDSVFAANDCALYWYESNHVSYDTILFVNSTDSLPGE